MRKYRNFIALILTIVIAFGNMGNVFAATYSWGATKTPGQTIATDSVQIPIYKGKMTFKVTKLTGSCSYLLGKCTTKSDKYYINTSTKSVMITEVGGEQSFYMAFVNGGDSGQYMNLVCSVEHNAGVGDLVGAYGTIYY